MKLFLKKEYLYCMKIFLLCIFIAGQARANDNQSNNTVSNDNSAISNAETFVADTQDEKNDDTKVSTIDTNKGIFHPKAANKWRTQDAVLESGFSLSVVECQQELTALANKAMNDEALLEARNILTQSIVKQQELYHWCFYISMMQLDRRLDQDDTSAAVKNRDFVASMKKLWIHGSALDAAFESRKYIGYLRRRYQELSLHHFGRSVAIIASPLGDSNHRSLLAKPTPKPAAE